MHTLGEVAEAVVELVGSGKITEVSAPPDYSAIPLSDTSCVRTLGWEPQVTFEEGLARTYESLLALV